MRKYFSTFLVFVVQLELLLHYLIIVIPYLLLNNVIVSHACQRSMETITIIIHFYLIHNLVIQIILKGSSFSMFLIGVILSFK